MALVGGAAKKLQYISAYVNFSSLFLSLFQKGFSHLAGLHLEIRIQNLRREKQ